jgi:ribonuclease Z
MPVAYAGFNCRVVASLDRKCLGRKASRESGRRSEAFSIRRQGGSRWCLRYDENGARVTAFKVKHGEIDAFGFRVDYKGRSVVISGDMSPNENFIKYAQGVNVVIHEVAAARPELLEKSTVVRRIVANHCTPEDAGKNLVRIKPRLAVYTHFALFSGEGVSEVTVPEIITRTRTAYSGLLEAGEDLMSISIGDTVVVQRYVQ